MTQIRDNEAPKPPSTESLEDKPLRIRRNYQDYKKILQDIFITPTNCWNTCRVAAALNAHETGSFSSSGRLVDAMMRDPRIFACCNTLVYGVLGLPFEWKWPEGYKPTEEDEKYLKVVEKWWKSLLETAVPQTLMKWVVNMGFAIMGKSWELKYLHCDDSDEIGKLYIPEIHVFHPANAIFNTATYSYYTFTASHGMIEVENSCDPRIQLVEHVDSERAFMQGAVRPLGLVWLDKWMAESDWRSYLSLFGNPMRILTTDREYSTPTGLGETDIELFIAQMAASLSYGAPVHLMAEEKLELLQANPANANVFKEKVEDANREIAIVYLGQNLTTEVSGGSFAAANVHNSVRQDYTEAWATTLNRAMNVIVKEFYHFNFPASLVIPEPFFNPEQPTDELRVEQVNKEKAQSMKSVAESLAKLAEVPAGEGKTLLDMISPQELKLLFEKFY